MAGSGNARRPVFRGKTRRNNAPGLAGKIVFITGATRGIGREIALKCARAGAGIVITGKTIAPHPRLSGTVVSVAQEIAEAGGRALPLQLDVRDEDAIAKAIGDALNHFGGIDILVNNASAISLTGTLDTPVKRFDLMLAVNARATFAVSQACIPHLKKSANPHIINLSPPINLDPKWFKGHVAYTLSKYGMSFCTIGMAAEFAQDGIAVNSLWPKTSIATAAIEMHFSEEVLHGSRKPAIMADAAHVILNRDARACTGNFFIDENVLREEGIADFAHYALNPGAASYPDLFLG